ncbi:MAG: 2-C-methyl-D-erythritol 4-phosphate cytidylyltransferase [Synechocystis sp.]
MGCSNPPGLRCYLIKRLSSTGRRSGEEVTDDAALFEKCQFPVKIIVGEETNLKVTTPVDLAIAEFIVL